MVRTPKQMKGFLGVCNWYSIYIPQYASLAAPLGEARQNASDRPAGPTWSKSTSTRTHARDPGVASSDPQGRGVGVHTKKPRCTGRVPC